MRVRVWGCGLIWAAASNRLFRRCRCVLVCISRVHEHSLHGLEGKISQDSFPTILVIFQWTHTYGRRLTQRPVQERREARGQEPAKGLGAREQLVGELHGQEPRLHGHGWARQTKSSNVSDVCSRTSVQSAGCALLPNTWECIQSGDVRARGMIPAAHILGGSGIAAAHCAFQGLQGPKATGPTINCVAA